MMTESRQRTLIVAVVAALLVVAGVFALYVRGGGPLPGRSTKSGAPLAASSPAEVVLRTLRLAGFDQAAVGISGGTVVTRVQVPELLSPPDAELSWQTAVAAAAVAYPQASRYTVQLFAEDRPLVEMRVAGPAAREAVANDDAVALKAAADFTYLQEPSR